MHDQQRLACVFIESYRGDGLAVVTFVVGPNEARVRCHFEVRAEELHRRIFVAKHQTILPPDANIHLAGKQGQTIRLWYPPPPEQFCLSPRLEHEARRAVDGSRGDKFALGLPFHRRAVLRWGGLTFSSFVHRLSPSVSILRQPCPTRRSVRPRVGGTSRSMPPLPA